MNDFFNLLLPWQETSNDQISDVFVYIIGGGFLLLLIYFSVRIIPRYLLIRSLKRKIGQYERPAQPSILHALKEDFAHKEKFAEAWQEFSDSLITRQHNENQEIVYKTDEAAIFFSEDRLLGQYINLRFWNSIPAILVGFGILGTFVGLVWGLIPFSDTDFQETDEIKYAIEGLLSGVSTAFVTSVWGMVASLIFNGIEKLVIGVVSNKIANLQRSLDDLFTLTTQEEIAFRQEDELAQQTQALKAFSTDLADKIKVAIGDVMSDKLNGLHQSPLGSQEIIQEFHSVTENVSNIIAAQLSPNQHNLEAAVTELKKQSELMGHVDQNLINFQAHSIQSNQEIVRELQKLVSSIVHMETSAEMTNRISESMLNLSGLVEQIADDIHNVLNQMDNRFEQRLTGMDDFIDRVAQNLQDIQQRSIMLLQLQDERIETINGQLANSQTILDKGKEMFEQMDESFASVSELIDTTKSLSETLKAGTVQLETVGKQLTQASSMFNKENANYIKAQRETTQNIQTTLVQSHQMLNDFAQNFNTIDKSLVGIFEEIEKGLSTYADITRESINKYLEDFSEQLAEASNALSGNINALKENVVILNDVIDQLRN